MDEGLAGCVRCIWAPDGRHVLSFSDFSVSKFDVASYHDLVIGYKGSYVYSVSKIQRSRYIEFILGFAFRSDGKYFALAERFEGKDYISIYDCEDWSMVKVIQS